MGDLGLTPEEVAGHPDEVKYGTKAYLGPLVNYDDEQRIIPIFERIGHLDHIYTDYPEAQRPVIDLTIGGVPKGELLQYLKDKGFKVSTSAEEMIRNTAFTVTKGEVQPIRLFRASIRALGFTDATTIQDLYSRIDALGADLCPAEVGPHRRAQYTDQPMNGTEWITMNQIAASHSRPLVFVIVRDEDGSWLEGSWALPDDERLPEPRIVFKLRAQTGKMLFVE